MPRRQQLIAAAAIIYILLKRRRAKSRRYWVKNAHLRRNHPDPYQNLLRDLNLEDPSRFFSFIRMTAIDFEVLLNMVAPLIKKKDTRFRNAIPPAEKLLITLRFVASGDSYQSLMQMFKIPSCTISLFVPEVCRAIYNALKHEIKLPSTEEQWIQVADEFEKRQNFPHCIGALDGKHITIKASETKDYLNYKGKHSIVLTIVVNAAYKILYINCISPGQFVYEGPFQNTKLFGLTEKELKLPPSAPLLGRKKSVPFVLVTDNLYPIRRHLMKPYCSYSQADERIFNYRLSRARDIVDTVFGVLASKYRILRKPIDLQPKKVEVIASTICALHNFMLSRDTSSQYTSLNYDQEEMPNLNLIPLECSSLDNELSGLRIQEELKEYFLSPQGEVPWQYEHIRTG